MKQSFDVTLLESGEMMKKNVSSLLGNLGRVVALVTAIVACLVTFTEVGFADVTAAGFSSTLLLMLTASYIIYFSLEDAGEKLGEESEEYLAAKEKYAAMREKIDGAAVPALRAFLSDYAKEECAFRKRQKLFSLGLSEEEIGADPRKYPRKTRHALRRLLKIRPIPLSPKDVLEHEPTRRKSELIPPESGKILRLALKLIPSTVCMCVTVSVMLTAKDGLTAADVIAGIMRLSTLPVIGVKGYAAGYRYKKCSESLWIETKTKLLDAFLKGQSAA